MSSLDQLKRDLREWQGKLDDRRRDEARRIVQEQHARRRAVDRRGDPDANRWVHLYREAKRRLRNTRHAIRDAEVAIRDKRASIRAREGGQRSKALRYARRRVGRTESPSGSNCTPRLDFQSNFGLTCCPWCGKFVGNALLAAGVRGVNDVGILSVQSICNSARARRGCFTGFSRDPRSARPGDLVILFSESTHVALARGRPRNSRVPTYEGNTSFSSGGSQSNGGAAAAKDRPFGEVVGIAHVRYQKES